MKLRRPAATLCLGIFVSSLWSSQATAADWPGSTTRDPQGLKARLLAQDKSDERRAQAIAAGRERASFCQTCHGADGISVRPWVPNLAGQNKLYLLQQILAYANETREDYVMNQMARTLSDEDIVDLAAYYASLPVERRPAPADERLAALGRQHYESVCQACHGKDGRGTKGYSWIAGQKVEYVKRSLKRYRSRDEGRRNPTMAAVTYKLSDRQIEGLAAYVSSLE